MPFGQEIEVDRRLERVGHVARKQTGFTHSAPELREQIGKRIAMGRMKTFPN